MKIRLLGQEKSHLQLCLHHHMRFRNWGGVFCYTGIDIN